MSKLLLLAIAAFVFCFGSVILMRLTEFGFAVADKSLENSGKLVKLPFQVAFKIIKHSARWVFKKLKTQRPAEYTVTPIYKVTPLHLQQMRSSLLSIADKREHDVIAYTQPKRLN